MRTDTPGKPPHPSPLLHADSIDRIIGIASGPHFDSNLGPIVEREEVDLPIVDHHVGAQYLQTVPGQKPGGELLP